MNYRLLQNTWYPDYQMFTKSVFIGWDIGQFLLVGLVGTGAFVCCLVHRGSTDYLLLLQIFSGVV